MIMSFLGWYTILTCSDVRTILIVLSFILFKAVLGYLYSEYKISFQCASIIISEWFVLTPAHCVSERRLPVLVRVGKVSTSSKYISPWKLVIVEVLICKQIFSTEENDIDAKNYQIQVSP